MRVVVQRANSAEVTVESQVVGRLPAPGLVILVGITGSDTERDVERVADKVWGLRQGARDYITKPVNPAELWSKISALE